MTGPVFEGVGTSGVESDREFPETIRCQNNVTYLPENSSHWLTEPLKHASYLPEVACPKQVHVVEQVIKIVDR